MIESDFWLGIIYKLFKKEKNVVQQDIIIALNIWFTEEDNCGTELW